MAYANVSHVAIWNQQRSYSGSTNPTAAQVGIILDWIAAEMDGALFNMGFVVPVTGPDSKVILQKINAVGAAAMAEGAAFMSSSKNESRHASWLNARFKEQFGAVLSGQVALSDALYDSERAPRRYMKSDNEEQNFYFSDEGLRDFVDLHKVLSLNELRKWLVQTPETYGSLRLFEGTYG